MELFVCAQMQDTKTVAGENQPFILVVSHSRESPSTTSTRLCVTTRVSSLTATNRENDQEHNHKISEGHHGDSQKTT